MDMGHPKETCKKQNCQQKHAQLSYSEQTKNIAGWADVVKVLPHPDILDALIQYLKSQQKSLGPHASVYWVDKCEFTLTDCLLLKSIIREVLLVRSNVKSATKQLCSKTNSPPGVKNPDNDPSLQVFRQKLLHEQIQDRPPCVYGSDPENFHADEDDHRQTIT